MFAARMLLLLAFLASAANGQGLTAMRFAFDPPKPQVLYSPQVTAQLGQSCDRNITCNAFNAFCSGNGTCDCLPDFVADPTRRFCIQAPFFNQPCADGICHSPFACNASDVCTCPRGYIEEFMQCVKECASTEIAIKDICYPTRSLGEQCEHGEQCSALYSDCKHGRCECISGTDADDGTCAPKVVCPSGGTPLMQGEKYRECQVGPNKGCFAGYFCMPTEPNQKNGYCCAKPEIKCPVGEALSGHNCTNCPWDTHHCYSYVISGYSGSMCCPNACPSSQPIRLNGRCYAGVAFGGACEVDDQCYSVVKASCRDDGKGAKRCLCPAGDYSKEFGQCLKRVYYGGECESMQECRGNTHCDQGVCKCVEGWFKPENERICVPRAVCPMPIPPERVNGTHPAYCNMEKEGSCPAEQFCHVWWTGPIDETSTVKEFAHCCPKPESKDFELLCTPYQLKLDYDDVGEPARCDLGRGHAPLRSFHLHTSLHDDVDVNSTAPSTGRVCDPGSACIFDPYTIDAGVCCSNPATGSVAGVQIPGAAAVSPGLGAQEGSEPQVGQGLNQGPVGIQAPPGIAPGVGTAVDLGEKVVPDFRSGPEVAPVVNVVPIAED